MADYRLRHSDVPIVVVHGASPLSLLYEIFTEGCYRPPEALLARLGPAPRILDAGANVGAFSAFARKTWPEAEIVAIEADPENAAALGHLAELDGTGRIHVVEAAASISTDPVAFLSGRGQSSLIHAEGDPVTAIDLLEEFEAADFLKLDIERGEWPILEDPRLATGGPLVIVMEYHRRFVDDGAAFDDADRLLRAAGFTVGHVRPNYWGHGTLWAWRD